MVDNWGATVNPDYGYGYGNDLFSSNPDSSWFAPRQYRTGRFTISELKPWVMNQQPHHISALADHFHNAKQLLVELEIVIRQHSIKLYNETWTQSVARDAFMQKGPGRVLAYLDDWQTQLQKNEDALRGLLTPIETSQREMEQLWTDYQREVAEAGDKNNLGFGEFVGAVNPNWHDWLNPLSGLDDEAQVQQALINKVNEVKERYDQLARNLVGTLSDAYSDHFFNMTGGVGASYQPPNVVMSPPGQKFIMPPAPPAGFAGGPPPGVPNVAAPPPPPALTPQQLQQLSNLSPPAAPPQAPAPNGPPGLGPAAVPTGPPVGAPPDARTITQPGNAPGIPPGFGPALPPGALPAGAGGAGPGALPGARPGAVPNGFGGALPPPGLGRGLSRGVLRNPGAAPGFGMLPPGGGLGKRNRDSTLRSPAANYTSTGAAGGPGGAPSSRLLPPPGAGAGSRRRAAPGMPTVRTGNVGLPEAFSQSSLPPPVAPVLGRQNRQGRRGADAPAAPPSGMRGAFAAPTATPPVLDASLARAAGSTLPPPTGIPPQQRSRRARRVPTPFAGAAGGPGGPGQPGMPMLPGGVPPGRPSAGRYTGRSAPNLVGNPDWLVETGPAESASTAPVLRNQMPLGPEAGVGSGVLPPPQPGTTAQVVGRSREAVRAAMAQNRTRPGARPPAQGEAELGRRARDADHLGRPAAAEEVRPGEEAFTVQTPGGAVVGGNPPARTDEAPRPTISNG